MTESVRSLEDASYEMTKMAEGRFGEVNLNEYGASIDGKNISRDFLREVSNVRDDRSIGSLLGIGDDMLGMAVKSKKDYTRYSGRQESQRPYVEQVVVKTGPYKQRVNVLENYKGKYREKNISFH